jgi:ankyrin repeat protein
LSFFLFDLGLRSNDTPIVLSYRFMDGMEEALEKDSVVELQSILAVGISVDATFSDVSIARPRILRSNPSIIACAAFYRAEKCFRFLLQNGANINVYDSERRSPAHFVAAGGLETILAMMMDQGIDWSLGDSRGLTPAHYAAFYGRVNILKWLWAHGVNVREKSFSLYGGPEISPLHLAAKKGNIDCVEFLIRSGVDGNVQDSCGVAFSYILLRSISLPKRDI